MVIKKNTVFLLLMGCSLPALAVDDVSKVNFSGGVSMGYTRLDTPSLDAKTTLPSYVIQGATSYGGAFVRLDYIKSLDEETVAEETQLGKSSYSDFDFTLGYRLARRWTVFAGYRDSETDIGFYERTEETRSEKAETYGKDGYYLGGSYSLELGRPGTITVNMGYSLLDTNNLFQNDGGCDSKVSDCADESADEIAQFNELAGQQNGTANGWSYGVIWKIPLSESMAFNTTFMLNDYKEKIDYEGESFSADQKMTQFNIGVLYSF